MRLLLTITLILLSCICGGKSTREQSEIKLSVRARCALPSGYANKGTTDIMDLYLRIEKLKKASK